MKKIVAVDVDLTAVDSFTPWMTWFEKYSGGRKVRNEDRAYDLVPEMKHLLLGTPYATLDPFSFWKLHDLYDSLEPMPGCREVLQEMSKHGAMIVFVSFCAPEHRDSKLRFLNKHFPFKAGFVDTHDKHFVDYDVLLDDKLYHIRKGSEFRPDAQHILFTGIREDGNPEEAAKYEQLSDWSQLTLN